MANSTNSMYRKEHIFSPPLIEEIDEEVQLQVKVEEASKPEETAFKKELTVKPVDQTSYYTRPSPMGFSEEKTILQKNDKNR